MMIFEQQKAAYSPYPNRFSRKPPSILFLGSANSERFYNWIEAVMCCKPPWLLFGVNRENVEWLLFRSKLADPPDSNGSLIKALEAQRIVYLDE
jgi:hypothetical protein